MPLTTTIEGLERYGVILRYDRDYRDSLDALQRIAIPVRTGSGAAPAGAGMGETSAMASGAAAGPVLAQVLEGENAIAMNRDIMGATDPKKAAPGTIRADLAKSIETNVVHGSDAPETAAREIAFFFSGTEICPRT